MRALFWIWGANDMAFEPHLPLNLKKIECGIRHLECLSQYENFLYIICLIRGLFVDVCKRCFVEIQ